jgi:hypothetical protein
MSHRIRISLAALGLVSAFATASPGFAYVPRVTATDLVDAGYTPTAGGGYTNGHLLWNCSNPSACTAVR